MYKKIDIDNTWKILTKKLLKNNNNYNDYEKEVLKFILDMYYEYNKSVIIKKVRQAKLIEELINDR